MAESNPEHDDERSADTRAKKIGIAWRNSTVIQSEGDVVLHPAGDGPRDSRSFFNHLISDHTRLFAGREAELAQITQYVSSGAGGYVFVEGLSGYGKTSLLANLVHDNPRFAYHFISQKYQRTDSDFDPLHLVSLLRNLCGQLLRRENGEPGLLDAFRRVDLRETFHRVLTEPGGEDVTVMLDAVDEVEGQRNHLFGVLPKRLRAGCTVILSARTQGDRDYLTEVGLSRHDLGLHLRLAGLDESAIADLLALAGPVTRDLAADPRFVEDLRSISQGDPFYLRFLVEDIQRGSITSANIADTPKDLEGYLTEQFIQLARSARSDVHLDLIGLVVTANTPMSRTELLRRLGLRKARFHQVVADVHRFLLVHDDVYTFCHIRFKEYFQKWL